MNQLLSMSGSCIQHFGGYVELWSMTVVARPAPVDVNGQLGA
jgi:hypothetical protein